MHGYQIEPELNILILMIFGQNPKNELREPAKIDSGFNHMIAISGTGTKYIYFGW